MKVDFYFNQNRGRGAWRVYARELAFANQFPRACGEIDKAPRQLGANIYSQHCEYF